MRGELSLLRRTTVSFIFERVTRAAERYAQTEGKLVTLETSGADVALERRVAERLVDPIVQLVRNAVAHGIGTPEQRAEFGKPAHGTISLRAERSGTWLRLQVEDDGRGADVERIRELAVTHGIVSPDLARRARDDELLRLLFSPGLSTAESSDLLAGRGIGLDLVQDALRRLGGAVSLQQRPAGGLAALLEVPLDQKLAHVLWIEEAGNEYALPVSFTGRVLPLDAASPPRRLSSCLGLEPQSAASLGLELVVHGLERVVLGVDGVGKIEEASIRAIGPTLAAAGPYCGAVLRSDGSLRLVLDAPTLAAQTRNSPRQVS
jgi:two-component system chemotaxis sensor kinase CheA